MTTEEQIIAYCEKKEEEKALSKTIKKLNSDIKAFLGNLKDKKTQVGDWQVELRHKVTEDIDELKLLTVVKGFWSEKNGSMECPFVKRIEVVDMDALEGAIYRNEIPKEVLLEIDGCRVKKENDSLVYKKAKKEGKE